MTRPQRFVVLLLAALALLLPRWAAAADQFPAGGEAGAAAKIAPPASTKPPETIFITDEYAFDYASNPDAPEIARAMCGTLCNALSGNYDSYKSPGGWRLIQIGQNVKKVVPLDSPFVHGQCICTGKLYRAAPEAVLNPRPEK